MNSIPTWDDLGFWRYACGCIQYQDGWDRCANCVAKLRQTDTLSYLEERIASLERYVYGEAAEDE